MGKILGLGSTLRVFCASLVLQQLPGLATADGLDPNAYFPAVQAESYRVMLADPTDLQATVTAAQELEALGANRDAIRLYHRVLQMAGDQPNVRLRIALLEYRSGNYPAALEQVRQAELSPLPPQVAATADRLREELEKRTSSHQFSAEVRTGWRYRTNATFAPDDFPLVLGAEFTSSFRRVETSRPEGDSSIFSDLQVWYTFDPQTQNGTVLETYLGIGGEKQFQVEEFDRIAMAFETGPRFQVDPGRPGWLSFRPAITIDVLNFQGEFYSITPGALLEVDHGVTPALQLNASMGAQWKFHGHAAEIDFLGNSLPPNAVVVLPVRDAADRDGLSVFAASGIDWSATSTMVLSGKVFAAYHDSGDDAVSRGTTGLEIAATEFFQVDGLAPVANVRASWGYAFTAYRDADTQVTRNPGFVAPDVFTRTSALQKRRDHDLYLVIDGELPLSHSIFMSAGLQYETAISNIQNYDHEGFTFSFGVGWKF